MIPGSPIAYWISDKMINVFKQGVPLGEFADIKRGMTTSDNTPVFKVLAGSSVCGGLESRLVPLTRGGKVFRCEMVSVFKGVGYRKWYGYMEYYVNWEEDGRDVIAFAKTINKSYTRTIVNVPYYFRPSVGFSYITSGPFSMRWIEEGAVYDSGGPGVFADESKRKYILSNLNAKPSMVLLRLLIQRSICK